MVDVATPDVRVAPLKLVSPVPSRNPADEFSPKAIAVAIPDGSRRARTQKAWMERLSDPGLFPTLRDDGYKTLLQVAEVLSNHANWETMTSRPTWKGLEDITGRSRSTVGRVLRLLREAGFLGVVVTGTSVERRPMVFAAEGGIAAVYVLAYPRLKRKKKAHLELVVDDSVDIDDTPTPSFPKGKVPIETRKNVSNQIKPQRLRTADLFPLHESPNSLEEMKKAAFSLKVRSVGLSGISNKWLSGLLKEFFLAGWTVADVQHAIDFKPSGEPWPYSGADGVRFVASWLNFRLMPWRDGAGTVRESKGQRDVRVRAERLAASVIPERSSERASAEFIRMIRATVPKRRR